MPCPRLLLSALALALSCAVPEAARAQEEEEWRTIGLMRVRDMTPFGLNRLDMLPAHAAVLPTGSFAFELNLTYQNTWALSRNVDRYLEERGTKREEIGPAEVAAILALPGEAYLVDGEYGLADLTFHYRFSEHLGAYATIPWYDFESGFLDATIEGFHTGIGISNAGRDHVPRNRFVGIADLEGLRVVLTEAPEGGFGDPVLGLRGSLFQRPARWNLIAEGAVKVAWKNQERLVSTGSNDYGLQLSLQRFYARNALYLSLSTVWFGSPDPELSRDRWVPTLVAGWETRLSRHANLILQVYGSRSVVQETTLDELSADKIQATLGVQWYRKGTAFRFGVTENLVNFDNTPDVGVNLSVAKLFPGASSDGVSARTGLDSGRGAVEVHRSRPHEGGEREAVALGEGDGERGGGAHRDDQRHAGDDGLLHDLEAEPAGDREDGL